MSGDCSHVFGVGVGAQDLLYIGCTDKSLPAVLADLVGAFVRHALGDLAWPGGDAREAPALDIFEIDSAPSIEEAERSAASLCGYFRSLGLDVQMLASRL